MEAAVVQLEQSVQKADKTLDTIAWKLDQYEKQIVHTDGSEQPEVMNVMAVLSSIPTLHEGGPELVSPDKCQDNILNWPFPITSVSVLKLLRSVNQVREEYENLRREISEVQQLQKQLTDTLRLQLRQVQGRFGTLRDKIIGGSH